MDIADRINAIEADLRQTRDEIKEILFDIRACLTEAQIAIPNDLGKEKIQDELKS